MHFPERRPDPTEERVLPLINVVFLLLIFFMLAGSLSVTEPFDIEPPASQSQGGPGAGGAARPAATGHAPEPAYAGRARWRGGCRRPGRDALVAAGAPARRRE